MTRADLTTGGLTAHASSALIPELACVDLADRRQDMRKIRTHARTDIRARVLIADNDSASRRIVRAVLEQDGHIVEEAPTGSDAYRLFEESRPDFVILDIKISGMDGVEACRLIRSLPAGAHVPILITGALDDAEDIARAFNARATDFQQKPINFTVLSHRVRNMLRARRTADDLTRSETKTRALLNAIPDLMFQVSRSGIFVDYHPARSHQDTAQPETFLGKHLSDVFPADVATLCHHFVRRALSTSQAQVFEYQLEADHGTHRDFEARIVVSGNDRVLGIVRDVTDRRQSDTAQQFYAYHDPLTKLPNRLLFRDRLAQALDQARQRSSLLAVIFLGIDRFQQVNDTFGHGLGDLVLQHVATQLAAALAGTAQAFGAASHGETGTLARFGGDEFTILIPTVPNRETLDEVIDRLTASTAGSLELDGQEVSLTASTGVSLFPDDGTDPDTFLKNADAALRSAKCAGRNSRRAYRPDMNAGASEILSLETQLRRALKRGEFQPYFQPIVDAATGRLRGAEALVRWQHPTRGLRLPSSFLPLAEEMGLSVEIGDQLLQLICAQIANWVRTVGHTVPVAMNLSDIEFRQDRLAERIQQAADDHGLNPCTLEVEITERVLVRDRPAAKTLLAGLHELGMRVAIDDFGTGYSSLSILKGLPIDTLKVDRSFISDITSEPEGSALTAAIIHMWHDLGMTVVAEGVETPEQLQLLQKMQCDEVQGFLFSEAVRGDAFSAVLSTEPYASLDAAGLLHNELTVYRVFHDALAAA